MKMKITIGNSKQITSRQNLNSGDVFYYNDRLYIAINTIDYDDDGYTYDSVNLSNGEPVYIGDEEVYCVDYEFIVK